MKSAVLTWCLLACVSESAQVPLTSEQTAESVWELEAARIDHEILHFTSRIEKLKRLKQQQAALRSKLELQQPLKKKVDERPADAEEELIDLDFENVDCREVLKFLADKAGVSQLEVDDQISASISIRLDQVGLEPAVEIVGEELRRVGLELWTGESRWKLVRGIPPEHPLRGEWDVEKAFDEGEKQEFEYHVAILAQSMVLIETSDDGDVERYPIAVEGQRFYFFNDDEEWIGRGSYKTRGDQAEILFEYDAPPDENEQLNGSLYYLKLRRRPRVADDLRK